MLSEKARQIGDQPAKPGPMTFGMGMTVRMELAKAAMQGLLSNPECQNTFGGVAADAFKQADAMLEALAKKEEAGHAE